MASNNLRQLKDELRQKEKGLKMRDEPEQRKIPLVVVESPYAGNIEQNTTYARQCIADSAAAGEAPIASHLLYTQEGILDENDPEQRALGIKMGLAWMPFADIMAVYTDLGISKGMIAAIKAASEEGIKIEYRSIVWSE